MKHQKNILIEADRQTSYKKLHELTREYFWYSHKNSYLLGNYQGDNLEQISTIVERMLLLWKKEKSLTVHLQCPKSLSKLQLQSLMEKSKINSLESDLDDFPWLFLEISWNQGGLNKKEIQLNLCKIYSIFISNDLYLFAYWLLTT